MLTRPYPLRVPPRVFGMGGVDGLGGGGFDLNMISYYTGKSIILFTFFYCSLNWLHYRDIRKKMEGVEKDDDGKGKKK